MQAHFFLICMRRDGDWEKREKRKKLWKSNNLDWAKKNARKINKSIEKMIMHQFWFYFKIDFSTTTTKNIFSHSKCLLQRKNLLYITFSRRFAIWWKWVILADFLSLSFTKINFNLKSFRKFFSQMWNTISLCANANLWVQIQKSMILLINLCYANGVILRLYCRACTCVCMQTARTKNRAKLKLQTRNFRSVIVGFLYWLHWLLANVKLSAFNPYWHQRMRFIININKMWDFWMDKNWNVHFFSIFIYFDFFFPKKDLFTLFCKYRTLHSFSKLNF